MPLETRSRVRVSTGALLDLPPPFRLVTLREVGDAFRHAKDIAPEAGAGTLVYVGRFDLVEFALVLEPEESLRQARRALYAGLAALADAMIVHAPPNKLITFDWPDAILVDGALVGGARLAWPQDSAEDEVPPWLVFGAMVRAAVVDGVEPGLRPMTASLEEEGFEDLGAGRLVESFARHFMVMLDGWQEAGFVPVAQSYLSRLPPQSGLRRDIDDNGDLLVRHMGKTAVERQSLTDALARAEWLDAEAGVPRL